MLSSPFPRILQLLHDNLKSLLSIQTCLWCINRALQNGTLSISVRCPPISLYCKYQLLLFCCSVPCIHLSEERNRDSCQEPASKAPTGWDHIHAAFPSSALHHGPVCCGLCLFLPTSLSSSLLSIQPFSCPPVVEIPCILLHSGLCW